MDTVRNISSNRDDIKTARHGAILQRMKEHGCSAADIAAVAGLLSENKNHSQQNRDRQRKFRARKNSNVTVTLRNVTSENNEQSQDVGQEVTLHEKPGILTYVEPIYVEPMVVKKERKKVRNYTRARGTELVANDFQIFWGAYPHKVGKPVAAKAFAKANQKVSLEQILTGLRAYIDSKPLDRPWCNPATWLNQERWDDKPASVSAKPLTFREAREINNWHVINESCGKGHLNGKTTSLRSIEGFTENHTQERGELGSPAIQVIFEPTGNDYKF